MLRHADILLVEDSPADIDLARSALESIRFTGSLHVATHGEEAMAFLRHEGEHREAPRPDLVLLDLNVPRLDGRGVLQGIRSDPALETIPVIVMSSSDTPHDVGELYALHSNCYVCKPVDLDDFFRLIESIVSFWFDTARLPSSWSRDT